MFDQLRERITREHVVWFVVSFVLATMLWGWVTDRQDPIQTRRFADISVEVPPLSNTLQVVNELQPALVEITGPRSVVEEVTRGEVAASLDMSEITAPGTYSVPVEATVPEDVRDASVEPRELQVQVEATASRTFPLTIERPTDTTDPRNVSTITPDVSVVTVSGPEPAVGRVDRVVLPIDLAQNAADFTASFEPLAVDAQRQPISDVEVLPQSVSAFVQVETRGKTVSVVPQTGGSPAEGHSVIQRTVVPQAVVVDGPPDILNDLLFVETAPVDISGTTESVMERVELRGLPTGVTVVDPAAGTVDVTVVIQEIGVEQELTDQPIAPVGLGAGLTARIEPENVTVVIDAPRDMLRTMGAGDVQIRVDLTGSGPGSYEIAPDVLVPQGVTWIGTTPETVLVVIGPSATPGSGTATPGPP